MYVYVRGVFMCVRVCMCSRACVCVCVRGPMHYLYSLTYGEVSDTTLVCQPQEGFSANHFLYISRSLNNSCTHKHLIIIQTMGEIPSVLYADYGGNPQCTIHRLWGKSPVYYTQTMGEIPSVLYTDYGGNPQCTIHRLWGKSPVYYTQTMGEIPSVLDHNKKILTR